MDNLRIDSHKLNYHPVRIAEWFDAGDDWEKIKKVYPIYIEISPSGICNHRCIFCAIDFMGYQKRFLDAGVLKDCISGMAKLGVKSVMFAGEGEPLLHKEMSEIAVHAKNVGIDTAFTTNATPLTEEFCKKTLGSIAWIKISIDAGEAKTYSEIHRAPKKHFSLVLENIRKAVKIRNENRYSCGIGAQMLLLPENLKEVAILAKRIRDAGCDYFIVKPYSQHPKSITKRYEKLMYDSSDIDKIEENLKKIDTRNFQTVVRKNTAIKLKEDSKPYSECYSVPFFWAYMTTSGDVYSCSVFLGDKRFLLGNIYSQNFQGIWENEKRKKNWELMRELDVSNCRKNCRMEECNRFLYRLKNPPPHVNFI
ncbi:MAG: radical SAM protein [Candidatus Azambacteria bacterium]|nr:radical SAM protein [Candidatus Azambacteria bacterium]